LKQGLFITFEGVEGAGKTTQIAMLRAALEREGRRVCVTREPGGDAVAEGVRQLLLSQEMSPRAELLLFLASRAQNVERVIKPELAQGAVVICDRFIDSSVAYQGVARGLGRDTVAALNEFATGGLTPAMTFLLDLEPETGLARQTDRNRMEAESLRFHQQVREGYLAEATRSPQRFCVLDADQSPETLHAALWKKIQNFLSV
jgi:dTMP kinase